MTGTARRPALRVVIVNYRLSEQIERQLSSGVFRPDDEVIVVDNASEPDQVTRFARDYRVRPLLLPENQGFAAGVNAAVRASVTSSPILLLNPDVRLTPKSLDRLVSSLLPETPSGPTGVAPTLTDAVGRVQVGTAGGPLTLAAVITYFCFLSHLVPTLRGVFLTRHQLRIAEQVDWLCMACLLLHPSAFERYGEIPEDELVYTEDLAWGISATASGARFRLLADVTVEHTRGAAGESARWIGAFQRLLRRKLPPLQATLAVSAFRLGLATRRAIGRRVT